MKIKIEGGTREEADIALYKAVTFHATGDAHKEEFQDPAMADIANGVIDKHEKMFAELIREISDLLDQEYDHGY